MPDRVHVEMARTSARAATIARRSIGPARSGVRSATGNRDEYQETSATSRTTRSCCGTSCGWNRSIAASTPDGYISRRSSAAPRTASRSTDPALLAQRRRQPPHKALVAAKAKPGQARPLPCGNGSARSDVERCTSWRRVDRLRKANGAGQGEGAQAAVESFAEREEVLPGGICRIPLHHRVSGCCWSSIGRGCCDQGRRGAAHSSPSRAP